MFQFENLFFKLNLLTLIELKKQIIISVTPADILSYLSKTLKTPHKKQPKSWGEHSKNGKKSSSLTSEMDGQMDLQKLLTEQQKPSSEEPEGLETS